MPHRSNLRRIQLTRTVGHHPEVVTTVELQVFACDYCDKTYKTEAGLERHVEDKH